MSWGRGACETKGLEPSAVPLAVQMLPRARLLNAAALARAAAAVREAEEQVRKEPAQAHDQGHDGDLDAGIVHFVHVGPVVEQPLRSRAPTIMRRVDQPGPSILRCVRG